MNNLNSNKINYTLTNKKEFIEWFNKTFIKFRATGKQESLKNKYEPYNYQKLLKNFINPFPLEYSYFFQCQNSYRKLDCTSRIKISLGIFLKTKFLKNGITFSISLNLSIKDLNFVYCFVRVYFLNQRILTFIEQLDQNIRIFFEVGDTSHNQW